MNTQLVKSLLSLSLISSMGLIGTDMSYAQTRPRPARKVETQTKRSQVRRNHRQNARKQTATTKPIKLKRNSKQKNINPQSVNQRSSRRQGAFTSESEPNNIFPDKLGELKSDTTYTVRGKFDRSDALDKFSFTLSSPEKVGFYRFSVVDANGTLSGQRLQLFKKNANGGFSFIGSTGRYLGRRLDMGEYQIFLEGEPRSSAVPAAAYELLIFTPTSVVVSRTVTLEVLRADARSEFDSIASIDFVEPDFYVKSRMDGVAQSASGVAANVHFITPNYVRSRTMPASQDSMVIRVNLLDADPGRDDRADITPSKKGRDLEVRYFPKTGQIIDTDTNRVVGRAGRPFTTTGTDNPKASMMLKISSRDNF